MELEEFNLYIAKGTEENEGQLVFKVSDVQWGNLWNIEGDEFLNLWQVVDRMDIYHKDYIFEPIDCGDYAEQDAGINQMAVYLESDRVAETLIEIKPEDIEEDVLKEFYINKEL